MRKITQEEINNAPEWADSWYAYNSGSVCYISKEKCKAVWSNVNGGFKVHSKDVCYIESLPLPPKQQNLQELIKAENLKEGDLVVCTSDKHDFFIVGSKYALHSANGGVYALIDGVYTAGDSATFEVSTKKPERHIRADIYIEAVNDMSIKWQYYSASRSKFVTCDFRDGVVFLYNVEYRKEPSEKELEIEKVSAEIKSCNDSYDKDTEKAEIEHCKTIDSLNIILKDLKGDL